jgi:hypothetical protein
MNKLNLSLSTPFRLSIKQYQLKLKLKEDLSIPLCKGKYFRFQVKLQVPSNIDFPKTEKIPLKVKIFTSGKPFRELTKNLNGAEILKGTTDANLVFNEVESTHMANFKLLINEVSCHFSGFNLLIEPNDSPCLEQLGLFVKPMLIKDITVMSKEKICKKIRTQQVPLNSLIS